MVLGNDARFKIDERFIDDNHEFEKDYAPKDNNENDLQKEKEMQLDILENILKVPIQSTLKNKETNKDPKFAKYRYKRMDKNIKDAEINISVSLFHVLITF